MLSSWRAPYGLKSDPKRPCMTRNPTVVTRPGGGESGFMALALPARRNLARTPTQARKCQCRVAPGRCAQRPGRCGPGPARRRPGFSLERPGVPFSRDDPPALVRGQGGPQHATRAWYWPRVCRWHVAGPFNGSTMILVANIQATCFPTRSCAVQPGVMRVCSLPGPSLPFLQSASFRLVYLAALKDQLAMQPALHRASGFPAAGTGASDRHCGD